MAVVTVSGNTTFIARGVLRTVWAFATSLAPTSGSIGRPLSAPTYADKTVSFRGPWVSGVTIVIEGSNTATFSTGTAKWASLADPQGNALSKATGSVEAILENPLWIRPRISARTGTLGSPTVEIISQSLKR